MSHGKGNGKTRFVRVRGRIVPIKGGSAIHESRSKVKSAGRKGAALGGVAGLAATTLSTRGLKKGSRTLKNLFSNRASLVGLAGGLLAGSILGNSIADKKEKETQGKRLKKKFGKFSKSSFRRASQESF